MTRCAAQHNPRRLPPEVRHLHSLRVLELSFNELETLEDGNLHHLRRLCALDLSFNRLRALPAALRALHGCLRRLRLGANRLPSWPPVRAQRHASLLAAGERTKEGSPPPHERPPSICVCASAAQVLTLLTSLTHLDLTGQGTVRYEHGELCEQSVTQDSWWARPAQRPTLGLQVWTCLVHALVQAGALSSWLRRSTCAWTRAGTFASAL